MQKKLPLAGLKVIELSRVLAGPWAGQLLADLGAEVIKIERPPLGDETRSWGPPFINENGKNTAAYFYSANHGKKSLCINFDKKTDMKKLKSLIDESDILIENFLPQRLKKYKLDYLSLKKTNPSLIYCSITGFGQTGPFANVSGYDFIIQALSGIMDLTGEPTREGQKIGVAFADIFAGLYASIAILACLNSRNNKTNMDNYIDIAMFDVQFSVLANQAMNYITTKKTPKRLGNMHPNIVPYQSFECRDKKNIIIAIGNDNQFSKFCQLLNIPNVSNNKLYKTNKLRVVNREKIIPILNNEIKKYNSKYLINKLMKANIPVAPINSVADAFAHPQIKARKMIYNLKTSKPKKKQSYIRSPIIISGQVMQSDIPAPALNNFMKDKK